MDETNVGVREFARQIGKTHPWVLKLIKAGKLPRNEDGTIPLREGLEALKAIEAEKKPRAKKQEDLAEQSPSQLPAVNEAVNTTSAYNKAKLIEKHFQAKLKELEFKVQSGTLIPIEEVEADAKAAAIELRGKLLAIPARISVICEGRTALEIQGIIEEEIIDTLKAFAKSRFAKLNSDDENLGHNLQAGDYAAGHSNGKPMG